MLRILVVSALRLASGDLPVAALAQYGYPAGYGGYGWGGWGSTPQSSLARGLGYFSLGRGVYNENTAVARSINTDTVMRWNQYMYLSHVAATNRYHARLQAEKYQINKFRAEIHDQLRNHPSNRDITDGDALDVLLDELLDTSVAGPSLGQIKTPIKPEIIQQIPFKFASEGMTICLDQMTLNETWPLALRVEAFRPEREDLRKAILTALEEDKEGDLEPKTIEAVCRRHRSPPAQVPTSLFRKPAPTTSPPTTRSRPSPASPRCSTAPRSRRSWPNWRSTRVRRSANC